MNVVAILSRVVCSIILVLLLACYAQVSPGITAIGFCSALSVDMLIDAVSGINAVTISLLAIVVLGALSVTRILEAIWNVLFSASILLLMAFGSYALFGASIALPHAIYNCEPVRIICEAVLSYQVPIILVIFIFAASWICASARGSVAITTIISYLLWYAITEFFSYAVHLWSNSSNPAAVEALNMILSTPWIIAAVPGAFFLIYALLMAFFETYITKKRRKVRKVTEEKKETTQESAAPAAKTEEKPAEPKPAPEPKAPETPAEPAPATKPEPVEPQPEEKPAETKIETEEPAPAEPAPVAKAETKPESEPKAESATV